MLFNLNNLCIVHLHFTFTLHILHKYLQSFSACNFGSRYLRDYMFISSTFKCNNREIKSSSMLNDRLFVLGCISCRNNSNVDNSNVGVIVS